MLQMGGNSSRVAALKSGTIQFTFPGATATNDGLSRACHREADGDTVSVNLRGRRESWLNKNRELAYHYMKCATKSIVSLKRNRGDSERIIAKYIKINDSKLAATEFEFVSSLVPDYITPTIDGMKLILENFGKEYPGAPRRDPKEFIDSSIMERLKQKKFVEGLKF